MNRWLGNLVSLAGVCAGMSLGLTCGCKPPASGGGGDAGAIPIGEYTSLTGKEATFGVSSHQGTQLAIDEINAAGGVLGKPLRLICEDDQSKAGEAATAVRKLIFRDKVVAVLGEVASPRSLEAAPVAQEARRPMVSPSSVNARVTRVGDYIFRVCFTDTFQGRVLAEFAWKTLKTRKVAILGDLKSDYSKGLAECFKERFAAKGGAVVAESGYTGGDKDFKAQLTAIKEAGPEAILVPGYYTDVGLIALQARELGIKVPLFGGDGWESSRLLAIGGAALEGDCFATHYSAESTAPKVQTFVKSYTARYGDAPDALAALGYDSAWVLAEAIKRAGTIEPQALRDALAATKDLEAVTGRITLDAECNPRKTVVMLTIKNGRFKLLESIQPE